MKSVLVFILCVFINSVFLSQNFFGDYTRHDFEKLGGNKLIFIYTDIDTITNTKSKTNQAVAYYNPKNNLIKIKYSNEKHAIYCVTDSFGELINVNKRGKVDTNYYSTVYLLPKIIYDKGSKILNYKGFIRFYNKDGLLTRCITDTTRLGFQTVQIFNFKYNSEKDLIEIVEDVYANVNFGKTPSELNMPKERIITSFDSSSELVVTEYFDKYNSSELYKSIITREPRRIEIKTYHNNKLIRITEVISK